ncbi:hypothetical protein ACIA6C_29905 [Streptomyces sp. NPDC051578]|uniref:hypothetical protein n=1 Tax=Streptomyces sp. NPDC051578 TaxID=3365662 RepID=UPI0037AD351F
MHLNSDGLCRACLRAIRLEDDADWVLAPAVARPRALQLVVGLGVGQSGAARALRRPGTVGAAPSTWQRSLKPAEANDRDRILPLGAPGQQALFWSRRTLTASTATALRGRVLAGEAQARAQSLAFAAEYGLARTWSYKAAPMIRLALAVRDAEGTEQVPDRVLADLPELGTAVGLILDRAGLLEGDAARAVEAGTVRPVAAYVPAAVGRSWPVPRSCRDCDGWMSGIAEHVCRPCSAWRLEPRGSCANCGRAQAPLRGGRCRPCHVDPGRAGGRQLAIVIRAAAQGRAQPARAGEEAPGRREAAALVPYGQRVLFQMRRDWTPVLDRVHGGQELPELSERAQALLAAFDRQRRERRRPGSGREAQRTLALLLRFLGAGAPVWEHDVHDLARAGKGLHARAACEFLAAHHLLTEAPDLRRDRDQAWVQATIADLPAGIGAEVQAWTDVLRGQGRRSHPARSHRCIRRYLAALLPILAGWVDRGLGSLREVIPADVVAAAGTRTGASRRQLATALRSLFRALKQERIIFRDPARTLGVAGYRGLPRPVRSERLPDLFAGVPSAFGRLVVALVAVHALGGEDIRALLLTDVDLARGRMALRRGPVMRTVLLEPFTLRLAADWLAERHRRWPASTNPYLLATGRTALTAAAGPVDVTTVRAVFPKGMRLDAVRQDRILEEARTSTDPLHLIRLFGISTITAMRYITAAHPERTSRLPR